MGMTVVYWSRSPKKVSWATWSSLEDLFSTSDVISVNVPLTPETRHLVGEGLLRRMKPTSVLVNTSRGLVVDTEALVNTLKRGGIAGAGLDVFEENHFPSLVPSPLSVTLCSFLTWEAPQWRPGGP